MPDTMGGEFVADASFLMLMATLSAVTLLAALESTSLSLALPAISEALQGTALEGFWSAISFQIASAAFLPVLGASSSIFGRKPVARVICC